MGELWEIINVALWIVFVVAYSGAALLCSSRAHYVLNYKLPVKGGASIKACLVPGILWPMTNTNKGFDMLWKHFKFEATEKTKAKIVEMENERLNRKEGKTK